MEFQRASGILLHPTSLPSEYGIGDLGKSALDFVDLLKKTKQTYWQVLPLGPTGYGDSPYQSFSAFAGNTNLISPDLLVEDGLLEAEDLADRPDFPNDAVDYGPVIEWKEALLEKAYARFRNSANVALRGGFEAFGGQVASWLDDYALFRAIKMARDNKSWLDWERPLRLREEFAILAARDELSEEVRAQKFYQFLFFRQWNRVKNYANGNGIKIIGDIPIFVAFDSADVWRNPDEFKLASDGMPKVVAGVPPDYFSETGQLWGNPIYDWEKMEADGFRWWTERVRFTLKLVDILRIDHFRGFAASWEVPGGDETAENGEWVDVPGKKLFRTLRHNLGDLPVMAEDLGMVTPDVVELRDGFGFPGMKILQYAFGGDAANESLPHNYKRNCVVFTGTHDNDTAVGWFESLAEYDPNEEDDQIGRERDHCLRYLNSDGEEIHWDLIRALWSSVADTAIVPMQDILGLGSDARMNLPATESGNWRWRFRKGDVTEKMVERLRELTELYGRAP